MINTKSFKIGAILGAISVLAISIFVATTSFQPIPAAQERILVPRPQEGPMVMGKEVSIGEAKDWAAKSNFTVRLPTNTRGLPLQRVGLGSLSPRAPDNPELVVGEILITYSQQPIQALITLKDFTEQGGILLIVQKKLPSTDMKIASFAKDPSSPNIAYVHGKAALYGPPGHQLVNSVATLTWVNGTEQFELVASGNHFSKQDLITIAQSIP